MLSRVEFMRRVPLFFVLFLLLRPHAFATWSVLAVSQISGRVVIASATCLALEPAHTLMKIQAVVVPGKGVAAAQALLLPSGANQKVFLRTEDVLPEAANAFRTANGTITDRVMAAMEAADRKGGDSRCTCETEPKPPTPKC